MTPGNSCGTSAQLCNYTGDIFIQMNTLVAPYLGPRVQAYREYVGAHLRHIIEHYVALAHALGASDKLSTASLVVDYDARERNVQIETDPDVALNRIGSLRQAFSMIAESKMAQSVEVHTRGGLQGEHNFITYSSVARELMFLNSHATHHFAILQGYAHQRGETLGLGLGKAPATVAHEQRLQMNAESCSP